MNSRTLQRLLADVPMMSDGGLMSLLQPGETQMAEHPHLTNMRNQLRPKMTLRDDGIAIVPVAGVLARKPDVWEVAHGGVEDTEHVLQMVNEAKGDRDVEGVLLDVDSPGGFMQGGPEVAEAIRNLGKPSVSYVGGDGASLAYWIASQAGHVVSSLSASVGSIGGYTAHIDRSKFLESLGIKVEVIKNAEAEFKAAGLLGTALTDSQRDNIQQRVQKGFAQFRAAVKSARPQIKDDAMRGQTFSGTDAKQAGLVDAIGGMSFAISLLKRQLR